MPLQDCSDVTNSFLIRWWRSNWYLRRWHHYQKRMLFHMRNISWRRVTALCYRLKISGAYCDLLDDAIVVFILEWVEKPAVWPREAETRCQNEVAAAHPVTVRITNGQLLDIAWKVVFHGEVDLLISASVGALEQFECLIVSTLRLIICKLNCLSATQNNCKYPTMTKC